MRMIATLLVVAAIASRTAALLPAEGFVNMADFNVKENGVKAFETLWADRKSLPSTYTGFKFFALLRREKLKPDGTRYTDGANYVSCTIWDSKTDFSNYAAEYEKQIVGPSTLFKLARSIPILGTFLDTPAEKMQALNPKAVKWDVIAGPVWVPGDRTYGEGRAEVLADIDKGYYFGTWRWKIPLPVESFVAITRLSIKEDHHDAFEQGAVKEGDAHRELLTKVDGFQGFFMLRRDQITLAKPTDGDAWTHATLSVWRDRPAYEEWKATAPPGRGRMLGEAVAPQGAAGGGGAPPGDMFTQPPQSSFYEATLITEYSQAPPPPPPPRQEGDKCADEGGTRALRRRLQAAALGEEQAWLGEWHEALGCWYAALPLPTQGELDGCMGALALHLGSKLDSAMRALGRKPSPAASAAAEPHCEQVVEGLSSLGLPSFPSLPAGGFDLPAMPNLLPWGVQKWQQLGERAALPTQLQQEAALQHAVPASASEGSFSSASEGGSSTNSEGGGAWSAMAAGAGIGFASVTAGAVLVLGMQRRQRIRARSAEELEVRREKNMALKRAAAQMDSELPVAVRR